MFRVEIVGRESDFAEMRDRWDECVNNSEHPNPFMTWAWLYTWWKHYSDGRQLQIILVWLRDELVGIGPFFREKRRWLNILPVRRIGIIGDESVTSEYQDIIVSRRLAQQVRSIIWRNLLRQWPHTWDVLSLTSVPEFSPTLKEITRLPNASYVKVFEPIASHYTALPESYAEYLALLTRKWRYTVRKKRRDMSGLHRLQFVEPEGPEEMRSMLRELMRIHRLGRSARGKQWSFQSERFRRFIEDVCGFFFEASSLQLHMLRIDGQAVSGVMAFRMGHKLFVYQQGVHPGYFKWSPGVIIFSHCIEDAIAKGMKEIDFLRGDDDYKRHWTDKERKSFSLSVVNKTFRGFIPAVCLRYGQLFPSGILTSVKAKARRL